MIPEEFRAILLDAMDEDDAMAASRGEFDSRMMACSVGEPFVTVVV